MLEGLKWGEKKSSIYVCISEFYSHHSFYSFQSIATIVDTGFSFFPNLIVLEKIVYLLNLAPLPYIIKNPKQIKLIIRKNKKETENRSNSSNHVIPITKYIIIS